MYPAPLKLVCVRLVGGLPMDSSSLRADAFACGGEKARKWNRKLMVWYPLCYPAPAFFCETQMLNDAGRKGRFSLLLCTFSVRRCRSTYKKRPKVSTQLTWTTPTANPRPPIAPAPEHPAYQEIVEGQPGQRQQGQTPLEAPGNWSTALGGSHAPAKSSLSGTRLVVRSGGLHSQSHGAKLPERPLSNQCANSRGPYLVADR
ncbi:hypothetical protein BX600DRAFT_128805 [Xylariales sp. PMI_506]|nr:hypothetical protein BX600DRAFT_128805 [Xylariales sp. PMI_506]